MSRTKRLPKPGDDVSRVPGVQAPSGETESDEYVATSTELAVSDTTTRDRLKKWPPWAEVFIKGLGTSGIVRVASVMAGVHHATAYDLRNRDPSFAAAWESALDDACDVLEAEARRRAIHGVDRPVFYKGKECGKIREYSDTLLIFLLKANRPEKYRESWDFGKLAASLAQSASGRS